MKRSQSLFVKIILKVFGDPMYNEFLIQSDSLLTCKFFYMYYNSYMLN